MNRAWKTASNNVLHAPNGKSFLAFVIALGWLCALAGVTLAEEKVHIVQKNETLSAIARQHGVEEALLVRQNGLNDADRLLPGQKLSIPNSAVSTDFHVVRRGESLAVIAKKRNVPVQALAQANQLQPPYRILAGQRLTIPGARAAEEAPLQSYTVQKGDSLSTIAASHGVSTAALARQNSITDPNRIAPGQTVQIPSGSASPNPAPVRASMQSEVQKALDAIQVKRGLWKNIVIHHSGNELDTPRSMDSYHRARRMENGLAYHFVIGNGQRMKDGEIYTGSRWIKQIEGGHLASYSQNQHSIGICLVGNFNNRPPTPKQMEALEALTRHLTSRCGIPAARVQTHRQINVKPTECPGRMFPSGGFASRLR